MNSFVRRLLAVAVAVALAQQLVGCESSEEKVSGYVESARELKQEGKADKAIVQLRNALKLDGRNVDAHLLLAEIAEAKLDWRVMYTHLRQVIEIDKDNVHARVKMAQLLLMSGDVDKAAQELAAAEALAPGNARALMLRGMILARQGKREEALERARLAYEADSSDADILVGYAAALLASDNSAASIALVDKGLESRPDDEALRSLRFQIFAAQGKQAEAAAELRTLALSRPGDLQYWRLLALYHMRNGDAASAEAALREAMDKNPQDVKVKLMLASYLGQRSQDEAIETLKGFIADGGGDAQELKFALAESYVRRDSLGEAVDVYQDIAANAALPEQQLSAKNQLARIALKKEDKGEASVLIAEILAADPKNVDALIARALVAIGERRTDDAITDLRVALRERPKADNALALLATAYLQNSALELAEESFFQALEVNPLNERAAIQYARLRMGKKDFAGAQKALDALGQSGVRSREAERLGLQLRLLQKDWTGATRFAGSIADASNGKTFEKYVLAVTLHGQQRYAEAIKYYLEALADDPRLLGAAAGAVRSYVDDGKAKEGLEWLRGFVAKNQDNPDARLLLADELARSGELVAAEAEYRAIIEQNPRRLEPYRALSAIALSKNDKAAAAAVLEKGLLAEPGSIELSMRLADVSQQSGNDKRAEEVYRDLLDKAPTLDVAANNLAVLVAGDGSDAARLEEAARIAQRFENSEQPWYADTLGWIFFQQGNPQRAVALLRRSVEKAPQEALFRYHLGAALYGLEEAQAAREQLERAEALAREHGKFPGYDEAMSLLAQVQGAG